ncbi:isoaspartyl peptidase/L-asparaginase family protein [Sphingomonas sp. GlSt437]|uniref:isoaspartyl peptidase/L-asparaginase family protein n=1 Tax=Sphingomonas sp. GlSt437 TaxID=3389970 RepID=UPI003A83A52C
MMSETPGNWVLAVHGGAGQMTRDRLSAEEDAGARAGLAAALHAGSAVLAAGGSALDAVEAAVRVLEDDPHFNAGRGAVLTYDGGVSLDAAIMAGDGQRAGAVAGVGTVRHPVSLARRVMTTPHVMLSGAGAEQFAREQGLEAAEPGWFEIPRRCQQLEEMKARGDGWFDEEMKFGTVGAVACDAGGRVAAATSTGGITAKRWGRIGDTPIIGAGTWADGVCAVSATGSGEYFIRAGVCHQIAARIALAGEAPAQAATTALAEVAKMGGSGGVIVVTPSRDALWHFNTAGMFRGVAGSDGARRVAIYGDEG